MFIVDEGETFDKDKPLGWITGMSLYSLSSDSILGHTKDVGAGISGSSWKYMQLLYCLGTTDKLMVYTVIAFLNGCFHHSYMKY